MDLKDIADRIKFTPSEGILLENWKKGKFRSRHTRAVLLGKGWITETFRGTYKMTIMGNLVLNKVLQGRADAYEKQKDITIGRSQHRGTSRRAGDSGSSTKTDRRPAWLDEADSQ